MRFDWLIILLLTTACSKSKSSDTKDTGSASEAKPSNGAGAGDFCEKAYKAIIEAGFGKCTDEDKTHKEYNWRASEQLSEQTCKEQTASEFVSIDAGAAARCVTGLESLAKGGTRMDKHSMIKKVADCNKVMMGKKAEGTVCKGDFECQAGLFCAFTDEKSVCAKSGGEGSNCAAEGGIVQFSSDRSGCAAGFVCGDGGKCKKELALGADCSKESNCSKEALCVAGKCKAFAKVGEACELISNGMDNCSPGTFCEMPEDSGTGTCTDKRAAGGACKKDDQCKGVCADGKCRAFCGST